VLPGRPHVPGPARLVAALLLSLQQLLKGAAAGWWRLTAWPLFRQSWGFWPSGTSTTP